MGNPDQEGKNYESAVQYGERHSAPVRGERLRKRGARPDRIDIMRTCGVAVAGGLLGVLLAGGVFLLLQPQSRPIIVAATATPHSSTPTPNTSGTTGTGSTGSSTGASSKGTGNSSGSGNGSGNSVTRVRTEDNVAVPRDALSLCYPPVSALGTLYNKTLVGSVLKADLVHAQSTRLEMIGVTLLPGPDHGDIPAGNNCG